MNEPIIPHVRVGFQDRDNFVRNLVTILLADGAWWRYPTGGPVPPSVMPVTPSAADRAAVLSLDKVKAHLRIELDQTDEDDYLTDLEMAARLHTENYLRREFDATVGQNVTRAMLMLIAHWYRNRETVAANDLAKLPNAYESLLMPERDFQGVY